MTVDEQADPTVSKASFDDIYTQPDPRPFFRRLRSVGYEVPQHGKQVFRKVLDAHPVKRPTMLDLCCSYGVVAALLNHGLDMENLYDRYTSDELADLSSDQLAAADRAFYASLRRVDSSIAIGLDSSEPAVAYAVRGGLLDAGMAEDLERNEPSEQLADVLDGVDVFTVTGGVGYITERTIDRLYAATSPERRPWFAALSLRIVPYDGVARVLERYGLVTEQLADTTFPQRRFADDDEHAYALGELAARGLDPIGKEGAGRYHVNVYLSRPAEQVAELPITEVLNDLG